VWLAVACLIWSDPSPAADRIVASVSSRLVLVPVTVTDGKGKAIEGLQRENFQVTEDSEAREIVSLGRQDGATALGIVLDLSGSMRRSEAQALAAARAIATVAENGDETFLVTFNDRPEVRIPLTRDPDAILRGLRLPHAQGGTALLDAVDRALGEIRASKLARRSLVVISDGGENASRRLAADLKRRAIEADTQIHSINIHPPYRKGDPGGRSYLLEELSNLTGGLNFTVRDAADLAHAAEKLARAMKEVYVLAYRPGDSNPGKWRKVRVSVTPPTPQRVRVTARSGYYFPE
jgi:Ca-activated chloride channel family protein